MKRNCGMGTAMLQSMGLRIQAMVKNCVCPKCQNKIGKQEHAYHEKQIWHKSCLERSEAKKT